MNVGNVPETPPVVTRDGPTPFVRAWLTFLNNIRRAINAIAPTNILTATATLDFGSINAAATGTLTVTVTGATTNDSVALGLPAAPTSGIVFQAYVSATDTVTVSATNITAAPIDPASATYRVTVFNYS